MKTPTTMKHEKLTWMILAIAWEHFLIHMIGTNCSNLAINAKNQSITTQYDRTDGIFQPYQAREYLLLWISRSLAKHGKVVLYTCLDNALISIKLNMYPEKSLEFCESTDIPELEGILYIAYG